jgi:hypothetical protein
MARHSSVKRLEQARPFNYMFFTPLYGVRNTGCPQISPKNYPKLEEKKKKIIKKIFFLGVIDPPEAFSAPQNAQFCS